MTILGSQETRTTKINRAGLGALYGFLGGAAFVLVAAYVDIWQNPHLPLGVNWSVFWVRLPLIALGMAFVGAATCWWRETWQGLTSGAVTASALALIVALVSAETLMTSAKFVVLLFFLVPFAVMSLPVAWIWRWLAEQHRRAQHVRWGVVYIAGLALMAAALGGGIGYSMKSPEQGLQAVSYVDGFLQDPFAEKNPISKLADVGAHADSPYRLYPTRSAASTEGFDVHIEYEDGYRLQCMVIVYPGATPYLSTCKEGATSIP